jgi:hypothetical protein
MRPHRSAESVAYSDGRQRRIRSGWCVWYSDPGAGPDARLCAMELSEAAARALARERNAALNRRHGVPEAAPFPFYFAGHGGGAAAGRDRGLDRWIDALAALAKGEVGGEGV